MTNPTPPPHVPRLFVIGDSISIQYGPYLEKFLEGKLGYDRKRDSATDQALANLDIPAGANGGDSAMVLEYLRLRRAAAPIAADLLLLNCGLHDIKTDVKSEAIQVPLAKYRENLAAILSEAAAMHLRVLWVRTTPVIDKIHNRLSLNFHRHAADVAAYNAAADTIMREAGVPIFDLHAFSEPFLPEGFIDHVHYTEDVRSRQAGFLAGEILRALAFPAG